MGGPVKTSLAGLYPGIKEISLLLGKFQLNWSYDSDCLEVMCTAPDGKVTTFQATKEALEDMKASDFVDIMSTMVKPKPYTAQYMNEPQPAALHCYDLGDGMLVPCDLVHEIINWMNVGKQHSWWMSKEMIEDDIYGSAAAAGAKSIAAAVDKDIMKAYSEGKLYPGKVIMKEDLLTAFKDYFIVDSKIEHYDFIPSGYYGSSIIDQIESAKIVAIPKKPAQITKQSLQHFHKLLGGKKDPFIK